MVGFSYLQLNQRLKFSPLNRNVTYQGPVLSVLLASAAYSVSRLTLQTLVASLVLSKLDYGCATLAGVPATLLDRLQSVLNAVRDSSMDDENMTK